jgi:hypothetical protein
MSGKHDTVSFLNSLMNWLASSIMKSDMHHRYWKSRHFGCCQLPLLYLGSTGSINMDNANTVGGPAGPGGCGIDGRNVRCIGASTSLCDNLWRWCFFRYLSVHLTSSETLMSTELGWLAGESSGDE